MFADVLIGIERERFSVAGGLGIAVLMGGAVMTHLRVKSSLFTMLPSLTLFAFSLVIAFINDRL